MQNPRVPVTIFEPKPGCASSLHAARFAALPTAEVLLFGELATAVEEEVVEEWRRCQSGSSEHNYYAGCNGDSEHLSGCSSHYEYSIRAQHCLDYMWTDPSFQSYYQAVDSSCRRS